MRQTKEDVWLARSASDKTDDWGFWMIVRSSDPEYNKTSVAMRALGFRHRGGVFVTRDVAERAVKRLNADQGADAFPKPDRDRRGKEPCGECYIHAGETCDVCGASRPAGITEGGS